MSWMTPNHSRERYRDLLREAQQERLIRQATRREAPAYPDLRWLALIVFWSLGLLRRGG